MKILILSTFEKFGGAAIAANRLMKALRKSGVDAKMLVRDKQTDDPNVTSVNTSLFFKILNKVRFVWERFVIFGNNKFSRENLFAVSIANTGVDISKHPLAKEADIIHLHWINQGFLSIKSFRRLAQLGKPVVWTMHDQWFYSGICHYTSGCGKYFTQCSFCPKLKKLENFDLSYKIYEKKKSLYIVNKFTFVGCSKWIANEAKKSDLCHSVKITSIPNPIDVACYNNQNKTKACQSLKLSLNKKLILFGACKVTDERKGFDYMKDACDILFKQSSFKKEDLMIIIFGGQADEIESLLPYTIHNIGYVNDMETKVNLYSAIDLFLIPSLEDNLPNTIMEAMSCSTPCVGFNAGGIPEMIDHKVNGYVAEYKNADDLAKGINWVLNEADYEQLSKNARKKVVKAYHEDVVAKQYIELYESLT